MTHLIISKNRHLLVLFTTLFTILAVNLCQAQTDYEKCIIKAVSEAGSDTPIKTLKTRCSVKNNLDKETVVVEVPAANSDSALLKRQAVENIAEELPFVLAPHKSNYVLPFTYNNSVNSEPFKNEDLKLDRAETKFQFSVKSRITNDLIFGSGELWLAYTNMSFWQAFNTNESSPFRETNHEPEAFLDFHPKLELESWKINLFRIGVSHQSNGRSKELSRSWNRIYALATVEKGNWFFSIKPWYRIPESRKDNPTDSGGDDNPDIDKFVGYGDLLAFYRGEDFTLGATLRNNLRDKNRLGLQIDCTFPLKDKLRGYVQVYNGYGESLVDYNASVSRIGIGIMFSDIL